MKIIDDKGIEVDKRTLLTKRTCWSVITTMEQEAYVKVDILESEIEAQLLDSILNERNIPHHIQSYHDTAYDGLFQVQKGWGVLVAPELWSEEIRIILSEIRQSAEQSE